MRTRQDVENLFQSIISALLPKMNPQLIRPAYQQNDSAGKSVVREDGSIVYEGLSAEENYIYIRCHQVPQGTSAVVYDSGVVETIASYPIQITVYGDQSPNIALCLFSMFRTPAVLQMMEANGLLLTNMDDEINEMHEILNGEWVERCDFEITFKESVQIATPSFIRNNIQIAESTDVDIITVEEN